MKYPSLAICPNVVMVQVDFDATTTERTFYRNLLTELREAAAVNLAFNYGSRLMVQRRQLAGRPADR